MKSQIYNQPKYYEIAFSFIDAKKQIKLFEKFIDKYSKIPVKKVLDIACGPALQLREFAKQKYIATGIDSSPQMINYLNKVAREEKIKMNAIKANMNKFKLMSKFDFAYIMMGSIIYTKNSQLFLSHLDSVASSLNTGGLYLIENLAMNWSDSKFLKSQSWTMRGKGIKVKTTYKITPQNSLKQIVTQDFTIEVNDKGHKQKFINQDELKIIFPEEFKLLVEKNNKFEFLGFFERYSTKKLKNMSPENIVLLRKK
ncbi:MAG: methyltransferase domain-containing protein [Caldithrix sp.]|nr:methyltransferase domain-containing protein [Caldithrix sp.]